MGAGYVIINVDDYDNRKFLEVFPSIKDDLNSELGIIPVSDLVNKGDTDGSNYTRFMFEFVIKNDA